MSFRRSLFIGPPDLDRLIRFTGNQPQTRLIKRRGHDTRFCVQRTGLSRCVNRLEAVTRLPIPETHGTVIAAGEEDVVLVYSERVDNGVVALEVLHEVALGTLPLLDAACAGAGEGEFARVGRDIANTLLVVREYAH